MKAIFTREYRSDDTRFATLIDLTARTDEEPGFHVRVKTVDGRDLHGPVIRIGPVGRTITFAPDVCARGYTHETAVHDHEILRAEYLPEGCDDFPVPADLR